MLNDEPISALGRLMLGYAQPEQRAGHHLCWALDARLAGVVRAAREPAIASIRLAWWRDALVRDDRAKGGGDPLIEAWRAAGLAHAQAEYVDQMIDGWAALIGEDELTMASLRRFGEGRGGGLFALLAGQGVPPSGEALQSAGMVWALWDLAGHVQRPEEATLCLTTASAALPLSGLSSGRGLKPLRLLARLAEADVRRGRVPKAGFEPRHYLKLLLQAPFS
ncbi:MAG: hypothetical protein ACKOXK_01400 [Chakrabartia sp.]